MLTIREIRGYKLFAGLEDRELSEIAKLCNRRTYECNTVVFDPGTSTNDIFILEEENEAIQIEIPLNDHDDRIIIHTLSKGETFGWAALGSHHVRTAIARSLKRVAVIAMNGRELMLLMERNHNIGYIVMKNLVDIISTRLAYTTIAFRHEIRKARKKLNVPVTT
jgi:CRP-like cAMP-binding protein